MGVFAVCGKRVCAVCMKQEKMSAAVHTLGPTTLEAEVGESLNSRLA